MLRIDRSVANTFKAAESSRIMLFSPGSVNANSVLVQSGYLSAEQMQQMKSVGVAGDVMSHFITATGDLADPDLDSRTLSMNLDAVRRCPNAIAVSVGPQKAEITRAVVTSGLCSALIVDSTIAESLLSAPNISHEEDIGS